METEMVQPPFAGSREYLSPTFVLHRRVSGKRENAAFQRPSEEYLLVVQ